jgi:hypothetical protein
LKTVATSLVRRWHFKNRRDSNALALLGRFQFPEMETALEFSNFCGICDDFYGIHNAISP